MKRIIRLTERDLTRIVKRVIMEQGGGDLASAGYTDTNNDEVGFFNFMDNEGFKIIGKSENIDNEIQNTDGFKPRYKQNIGDYTIFVILKMENPRQTSRISIYDSEGFVGGEDIKNIEEKGEDPKWGSFISYKIDYDGIKNSLMSIMSKYDITGTPIEESYRRSYRRY
jgi:hypothetical protein